jgi:lipopolysaccharide export LptBFGC system permease protein LptF
MIFDESDGGRPFYVFAEEGVYGFDAERAEVHLRLRNGDIHFAPGDPSDERYRRIVFEEFDYAFDVSEMIEDWSRQLRPQEMDLAALREALARARAGDTEDLYRKDPVAYEIQLQRRLALPGAPLVFALVGAPLALRRARGARSSGALVGGLLFFGYYALLRFGERLGADGVLPPVVAMWLPNLAFATLAVALLRRATRPN